VLPDEVRGRAAAAPPLIGLGRRRRRAFGEAEVDAEGDLADGVAEELQGEVGESELLAMVEEVPGPLHVRLDDGDEARQMRRLVDGDEDVSHGLPSRIPAREKMFE